MSNSNQEIIEARLATYIDGELDPAERVEIEAHLEQNPQYRRLVEELRKGREMLRCLPREAAPSELAEAFASQLERSVLLDGGGEKNVPRMRIGAWPRMIAAAAIVTLAIGLAAIVAFVLPGHGKVVATGVPVPKVPVVTAPAEVDRRTSIVPAEKSVSDKRAAKPNETAREVATATVNPSPNPDEPAKSGKTKDESAVSDDRAKKDATAGGPGVNQDAIARNNSDGNRRAELRKSMEEDRKRDMDELARTAAENPQVMKLLSALPEDKPLADNEKGAGEHAVVIVVRSNDPAQVQLALAQWCDDNKINLQPARKQAEATFGASANRAGEGPGAGGQGGQKGSGLERAENEKLKALGGAPAIQQKEQKKTEALAEGTDPAALAPGRGQAHPVAQVKPGNIAPASPSGTTSPALAKAGTAPDASDHAGSDHSAPAAAAGAEPPRAPMASAAAPKTAKPQSEKQDGKLQNEGKGEELYFVARRLSRQDAQKLNACLSHNGQVSQADVSRGGNYKQTIATSSVSANLALADKGASNVPGTQSAAAARREAGRLRSDGAAGPKTQPADEIIQRGDQLRLTSAADKDGKEQSETVVVHQDGTIEPQVVSAAKGKVQAAGKTVNEVERALQETTAGQAAGGGTTQPADPASPAAPVAPAPPVKVMVLSQDDDVLRNGEVAGNKPPAPTTRPVGGVEADAENENRERRLTTAPAVAVDAPATKPVDLLTDLESVDVVIVVQSDAAPALNKTESPAAAAPAAQPNAGPATTPVTQPAVPAPETPSDPAK